MSLMRDLEGHDVNAVFHENPTFSLKVVRGRATALRSDRHTDIMTS
jgi:hypothetical protein